MYHKYSNVERVKPSGLELQDHLVGVQRVTKVTKGGRAFGFSAIVVVGDGNGVVGHGLGKSKDVASAIAKAIEDAKKNLVRIPIINQKGTNTILTLRTFTFRHFITIRVNIEFFKTQTAHTKYC